MSPEGVLLVKKRARMAGKPKEKRSRTGMPSVPTSTAWAPS